METVRDLNIDTDDMQVVLSAISSVSRRIKEVAQTHKPLFGGEHFLTGKEVCERLYISPRTLQDYRDRKIIPYTQFAGKILYKASDLERLLEDCYRVQSIMRPPKNMKTLRWLHVDSKPLHQLLRMTVRCQTKVHNLTSN